MSVRDDTEEISLRSSISSVSEDGGNCGGGSDVGGMTLAARLRVVSGYGVEGVRRDVFASVDVGKGVTDVANVRDVGADNRECPCGCTSGVRSLYAPRRAVV